MFYLCVDAKIQKISLFIFFWKKIDTTLKCPDVTTDVLRKIEQKMAVIR